MSLFETPVCPIMDQETNAPETRLCEFPITRMKFLDKYDGIPCHHQGTCLVCACYPDSVQDEHRAKNPIDPKDPRFVWTKPSCHAGY